jgi:hypothetical protein
MRFLEVNMSIIICSDKYINNQKLINLFRKNQLWTIVRQTITDRRNEKNN